jgi:aryl-alcohol dehydrogenase-like predicted oxidoreductase
MQLTGPRAFGPPADRDEAVAVLRHAVARGVDHIDTAQYYGPDVANEILREALDPYPDGLRIDTKVGARRGPDGEWLPAAHPAELREQVEANLRCLGLDRLSLVNLRVGGEGMPESDVPMEESLGALADLRAEGKIERLGLSAVTVEQLEAAAALTPIASVSNRYGVLDRTHQPVLDATVERGIAFVPFFPLGSAFMGGPAKLAKDPAIAEVAAKHGATPAQVALAWLLALAPNVEPIPGTASRTHLDENLDAEALRLDADDLSRLRSLHPVV